MYKLRHTYFRFSSFLALSVLYDISQQVIVKLNEPLSQETLEDLDK